MSDKERKQLELQPTCLETGKQLLSILRKIDSIMTHLGREKYSTLSWYLTLLTSLKTACINDNDSDDDEGEEEQLAVSSLKNIFQLIILETTIRSENSPYSSTGSSFVSVIASLISCRKCLPICRRTTMTETISCHLAVATRHV